MYEREPWNMLRSNTNGNLIDNYPWCNNKLKICDQVKQKEENVESIARSMHFLNLFVEKSKRISLQVTKISITNNLMKFMCMYFNSHNCDTHWHIHTYTRIFVCLKKVPRTCFIQIYTNDNCSSNCDCIDCRWNVD